VRLAAGGEVGIQPALLARLDVACAAVARVGDQLLGQLAGIGLDPLHYGKEVVLVCCLVADPHRHDDLVVAIDRRLAVVALDPAVPTFADVAVGIGVAEGPRSGSSVGPWLWDRQRQWWAGCGWASSTDPRCSEDPGLRGLRPGPCRSPTCGPAPPAREQPWLGVLPVAPLWRGPQQQPRFRHHCFLVPRRWQLTLKQPWHSCR